MSANYDNWERLVDSVLKKQQIWELCHQHSRSPSLLSQASDLSSSFSSTSHLPFDLATHFDLATPFALATPFDLAYPFALATSIKKSKVAILAFVIAGLMSKLLHLWQSLSDENITCLRDESVCLEGVRKIVSNGVQMGKIVSNDDDALLGLACAELVENLESVAKSISWISKNCKDPSLRSFNRILYEFANWGQDPNKWLLGPNKIKPMLNKMKHLVTTTTTLHNKMEELLALEESLKNSLHITNEQKLLKLQHKKMRQKIEYLKEESLWSRSFDTATSLLVRSVFTILSRINFVFGVGHRFPETVPHFPITLPHFRKTLPRSLLTSSALVYPYKNHPGPNPILDGVFELNSKILEPPLTTLGAAALSLHYSNLIIMMEKMIESPQPVWVDARDDLYSMLPNSIRFALRDRLKGVRFSASDPVLAAEWRDALQRILGWLSPLAHNMIKWQSERSFEQQQPKTNVLLLQTLYFANQEKTEAVITELLVGLNYIWRFEREMNAKAKYFS